MYDGKVVDSLLERALHFSTQVAEKLAAVEKIMASSEIFQQVAKNKPSTGPTTEPLRIGAKLWGQHSIVYVDDQYCVTRSRNERTNRLDTRVFDRETWPNGLYLEEPVDGSYGVLGTWPELDLPPER